jgi:hypothetical protein
MPTATIKLTSKTTNTSCSIRIEALSMAETIGGWLLLKFQAPPVLDLGDDGGSWFWDPNDRSFRLYPTEPKDWLASLEGVPGSYLNLFCKSAVRGTGTRKKPGTGAVERIAWEIFDPCA